jgi:hypothetical protein
LIIIPSDDKTKRAATQWVPLRESCNKLNINGVEGQLGSDCRLARWPTGRNFEAFHPQSPLYKAFVNLNELSFESKPTKHFCISSPMKLTKGNLHSQEGVLCITTNGFVKSNGEAVMGKGCAKQLADQFAGVPALLGKMLSKHGNRTMKLPLLGGKQYVTFPVKSETEINNGENVVRHMASRIPEGSLAPGWACKARLDIIKKSAKELVEMADKFGWEKVVIPRPGCGAGELQWEDVKAVLEPILDDRFEIITY